MLELLESNRHVAYACSVNFKAVLTPSNACFLNFVQKTSTIGAFTVYGYIVILNYNTNTFYTVRKNYAICITDLLLNYSCSNIAKIYIRISYESIHLYIIYLLSTKLNSNISETFHRFKKRF